ncbi:hypothetical protein BHE74_00046789 [Ensete ventricosum]|nr:hypothetical protein BHE74_00046789 [Ensete ventricosum]
MMRLGTRLECVESSPRVSGAGQDGIREFAGIRRRLAGRLSGVVKKLVGSWKEMLSTVAPPALVVIPPIPVFFRYA